MSKHVRRSVLVTSVIVALAFVPAMQARGDFVLWDDEQLTVSTDVGSGRMYDRSQLYVVPNGYVSYLRTYNFSAVDISGGTVTSLSAYGNNTVRLSGGSMRYVHLYSRSILNMSGGEVSNFIIAWGASNVAISGGSPSWLVVDLKEHSTLDFSGGWLDLLNADDSSIVNLSGGSVDRLNAAGSSAVEVSAGSVVDWVHANENSTVDVSGGIVNSLYVYQSSAATLYARELRLSAGLSLEGEYLRGTGVLWGEWLDGSLWRSYVSCTDPGATIRVIPEPATLLVLAVGGLGLLIRRRRNGR